MEEPLLMLLASVFIAGIVLVDRWAVANFEENESARAWCKAQFMFSRDPRGAVLMSSYVMIAVAAFLTAAGCLQLLHVVG